LYRHREYLRRDREKKRTGTRETWYRGSKENKDLAPLIIDPTPDGMMAKEMTQVIKLFKQTHGMGVKLMERGGRRLSSEVKSDPLGGKDCKRGECPICKGDMPGNCDKAGIGYRQVCLDCKGKGIEAAYEGESARTAYHRGLEHEDDLAKENEDSPLWKHSSIHHKDQKAKFQMEVTGVHRSAMRRLSDEVVRIKSSNADIVLNSKNDWAQPALLRIVAVQGNSQETQEGDTGATRQERRSQRTQRAAAGAAANGGAPSQPASQPTTPRRRRRRAAIQSTPVPAAAARTQPAAFAGDRESRRLRRAAASQGE
jgi:hypothetical protein